MSFSRFSLSLETELDAIRVFFSEEYPPHPPRSSYAANFHGMRRMSAADDIPDFSQENVHVIEKRYRFIMLFDTVPPLLFNCSISLCISDQI